MNLTQRELGSILCDSGKTVGGCSVLLFARLLLASCSLTSLLQHDHEVEPLVFFIW